MSDELKRGSLAYLLCSAAVSAKFVFDNDINAVSNPSEDIKTFIKAIEMAFDAFGRLQTELPLYKLYNNQVARMYKESMMVRFCQ